MKGGDLSMKFVTIPFLEDYKISKHGIIIDNNNTVVKSSYHGDNSYVTLNGKGYSVMELLRLTFISLHPIPWEYRYGKGKRIDLGNFYPILKITPIDDTYIKINTSIYKRINEYPDYYISNDGTVYSSKSNTLMAKKYDCEYPVINFSLPNRKNKIEKIHRLVFCTWNDIPLSAVEVVHHRDNRRYNSAIYNLENSTHFLNTRYAILEGRKPTQFTIDEIENFCKLYLDGLSFRDISIEIFGNDSKFKEIRSMIYRLKLRQSYIDIAEKYNLSADDIPSKCKLTDSEVAEICQLIDSGNSLNSIAKKYNVTWPTIRAIQSGARWKHISKKYDFISSKNEGSTTIERVS